MIEDLHLNPKDIIVNLDVVSLSTNVLVDETREIVRQDLVDDTNLHERTHLTVVISLNFLNSAFPQHLSNGKSSTNKPVE